MERHSAKIADNGEKMGLLKINSPKLGPIEYKEDDLITLSSPYFK